MGRFHIKGTCVSMIDVDPKFQNIARQSNVEIEVHGRLLEGSVRPGMFANIRPHLRQGQCFRIKSIEEHPPKDDDWRANMEKFYADTQREHPVPAALVEKWRRDLDDMQKVSYTLTLVCPSRREFEELYAMDLKDEDVEIFADEGA